MSIEFVRSSALSFVLSYRALVSSGDNGSMSPESFSHYRIISRLGAGGMGDVYLAEDTQLHRTIALKILPAALAADRQRMHRFIQEAKAASSLNHPNILTVYEIGQADTTHFIATEFIKGETLRQHLKSASVKIVDALNIAIQIADALIAAHEAGIVHRDIKPENIMLRADGYVKVLDFGLAKLTEPQPVTTSSDAPTEPLLKTEPGVVMGTVQYMSPEQARGLSVDARTDIWSSGVVLYEMLAGCLPFDGATKSDVLVSILGDHEPPPLSGYRRDVPAELERITGKALRKNRDERYQHVKDFALDLKDLKRELEFAARLERSAASDGKSKQPATRWAQEEKTVLLNEPATTAEDNAARARKTPVFSSIAGSIKRNKRGTMIALAAIVLLSLAVVAYNFYFARGGKTIDSIAVLPFANTSNDPNTEYLSDGMTESLINRLSQVSGLRVMSSSSVFRYKGKEQDAQKIGSELNVRAVLTGNVKQVADQLVINVSLDDAKDNHRIWGEQYVRKFADILAVQNEIVQEVSTSLRVKLTGADEQKLARRYTESVEAYQLYLKGNYEWNKHTEEALQKAIEYYNQAIEQDPNYALAYQGLSGSYGVLGNNYLPPNEAFPKAKTYAAKALALDDTLAIAHASMGAVRLYYDWDWAAAEKEFKRAQNLDPNNAMAHHLEGDYLEIMGRFDEAKVERRRALELDPLSPLLNWVAGTTPYFAGQYDEAIAQLEKAINLESRYPPIYFQLGQAYEQKRMYAEAIATYQKGIVQAERNPQFVAALGHAYVLSGKRDKANESLNELREMSKHRYVSPYWFAIVYIGLGDKDQAFAWLDKAYQDRAALLIWLKVEPLFNPLRSDPRYAALVHQIGLNP